MNAGASTSAVPSPIEGSGTAWVLLGSWALSPARPTPIHPRPERRGFSALLVKNVLLVNALLVILFLSDTHGGRTHDLRIAEATPYPLPAGSGLLQDLGFLSFTLPHVEILMPTKKPRGAELTLEQQWANQELHQRRLRIEHVNSSVKRCRIVKDRIRL